MEKCRVLIKLNDRQGIVCKLSKLFYEDLNLNTISTNEFVEPYEGKFFTRTVLTGDIDQQHIEQRLKETLPASAEIDVRPIRDKNIIIFATKESHALGDLLIRHEDNALGANILAVIANHNKLKSLVDRFDIPFHMISAEGISKEEHEQNIKDTVSLYPQVDYLVLAKYMRILSGNFIADFRDRIINIHHSFLPAFIGANPYKQAYDRGVKIIGATAHYVTEDLDQGPIISQDTINVSYAKDWKQMQSAGRNVEKIVLANALKWVFEDRVFIHDNKTIIL